MDTAGEAMINPLVTFFYGPLHEDVQVIAGQLEFIYISLVRTHDVLYIIEELILY